MPVSKKKLKANRQNAQKSTGPKTSHGKQIASRNSIKHGLFAGDIIVVSPHYTEDPDEYRQLVDGLTQELAPATLFQECLVRKIANCLWRSRRVISAETAQINNQLSTIDRDVQKEVEYRKYVRIKNAGAPKEVAKVRQELVGINSIPSESSGFHIQRYEMRLDRQMTRAYHLLQQLQKAQGLAKRGEDVETAEASRSVFRSAEGGEKPDTLKEGIADNQAGSEFTRFVSKASRSVFRSAEGGEKPDTLKEGIADNQAGSEFTRFVSKASRSAFRGAEGGEKPDTLDSVAQEPGAPETGIARSSLPHKKRQNEPKSSHSNNTQTVTPNSGVEAMFTGLSDLKSEWDIRHSKSNVTG